MWRILQAQTSDSFVLATNRKFSVRNFVSLAGKAAGYELEFLGQGENETAVDVKTGKPIVRISPKYYRPAEVDLLIGDPAKARAVLGWEAKTSLEALCELMVEADLRRNSNGISY
jgi:GDPmannose 4,6-dehydratase